MYGWVSGPPDECVCYLFKLEGRKTLGNGPTLGRGEEQELLTGDGLNVVM